MLATLEGLISHAEGQRLAELAAAVPYDESIVELGSYKGKSTAYLASSGHRVHAIDRWTLGGQRIKGMGYDSPSTWEDFWRQLRSAGVDELVHAVRADTVAYGRIWRRLSIYQPIGLLFIDADHSEASVRADLEAWEPHLAPGAVVAFDDYAPPWPGVMKVADDLIARRGKRSQLTEHLMAVWT